jgi:putative ABC transport system substrate-binding protein
MGMTPTGGSHGNPHPTREFIFALGSAAAWPLAARAQGLRGPVRLAFIPIGSPSNPYDRSLVEVFQRGLRRVGLIENQDVALDIVWAGDRPDQAVTEALQRGAELLIPCGSSASVAAKRQTSTIPIVFLNVGNPVAVGGAKPADLPVEAPSKVELLVNLQVAKTLGIEVPLSLLIRADELLE